MGAHRTLVSGKGVNDMPRGWIEQSKQNERVYYMWKAMLRRTREDFWIEYPTYTGTTVSDSRLNLSCFAEDIKTLAGYDEWAESAGSMMMLDKDTIKEGNKHYSRDTCCFISHADSNRDVSKRHPENIQKANKQSVINQSRPVRVINKMTGEELVFPSLKEACRQLDLNQANAWMALSERYPHNKSVNGYIFEEFTGFELSQKENSARSSTPCGVITLMV